jgi:hypothetical protein
MRLPLAFVVALAVVTAAPRPAIAQAPMPPVSDLAVLTQWLTGEFDNFLQVFEEKENKTAPAHGRLHTSIEAVAAPHLGTHVLVVRESKLNDPDTVGSLHVYSLVPGAVAGSIELRLYAFPDPKPLLEALKDASKPPALSLDGLRRMTGCEVTWRRDGEAFTGTMKPGACRVTWGPEAKTVTVSNAYRLTATELAFTEQLTDQSGAVLFSQPGNVPFALRRARLFTCWAALRKEGTTDQYDGWRDLAVHDQGKFVPLPPQVGASAKYFFELSQLRYNQQLPVMKLALYEAGKEQAFAYTWADPASPRIGINLRWIQAGCTAK